MRWITEREDNMLKTLRNRGIKSNKELQDHFSKFAEYRDKRNKNRRNVRKLNKFFNYLGRAKYREIIKMDEWKELEIGNIPSDFFVNENYEIKYFELDIKTTEWRLFRGYKEVVVKDLREKNCKYRYRLKPHEPIRITMSIFKSLHDYHGGEGLDRKDRIRDLENRYGRQVEIID